MLVAIWGSRRAVHRLLGLALHTVNSRASKSDAGLARTISRRRDSPAGVVRLRDCGTPIMVSRRAPPKPMPGCRRAVRVSRGRRKGTNPAFAPRIYPVRLCQSGAQAANVVKPEPVIVL